MTDINTLDLSGVVFGGADSALGLGKVWHSRCGRYSVLAYTNGMTTFLDDEAGFSIRDQWENGDALKSWARSRGAEFSPDEARAAVDKARKGEV